MSPDNNLAWTIPLDVQIGPFKLLITIVCLVTLLIIFKNTNESIGNKREVLAFRCMLISYMIYALVDLRFVIGDAFYTSLPRLLILFITSLGFTAMSFSCFFWFMHVSANLYLSLKAHKSKYLPLLTMIFHIPMAIILVLLFTPLYINVYAVEGTNLIFKPILSFILALDYIYLIMSTVISAKSLKSAKTKIEKRKYRSQLLYIISFTLCGLLLGFMIGLPAIELVIMPVTLKLFVELQNSQIYTDALTKLYNRRRMNDFINEELSSCSVDHPLTIVMIDMDFFKSINDILGHDEGDRALIHFADALRQVIRSDNAIASRWGGDEFIVAGKSKEVFTDFRPKLQAALDETSHDFTLSFSLGMYKCTAPDMSAVHALSLADAELYKDKSVQHKHAEEFTAMLHNMKANAFQ